MATAPRPERIRRELASVGLAAGKCEEEKALAHPARIKIQPGDLERRELRRERLS